MKQLVVFLPPTALLACWLFFPGPAQAQLPGSVSRPGGFAGAPVSPYLNVLRQGSPAGVNYYDLVRPQFQTQNSILALQGQVTTLGNQVQTDTQGPGALPVTGHTTQFFNYSHYFSSRQGQAITNRPPARAAR
jgi:hypothetical protein